MRPIFRIKSKSLPHTRQKLYDKITINFSQQKWRSFLQKQLSLDSAIRQLSRAQFDISNQNQHKISVRQNFQMKKQIAAYLQREDTENALKKLKELSVKMEQINQDKGVKLMIVYLETRNMIKEQLRTALGENTIKVIREKLQPYHGEGQTFLVKIKTKTILSILLLRFHGILMSSDERNVLVRTINMKKQKLGSIDLKIQRQAQFECMIYLMSEFYKLLFLLKKDQQMIMEYYNTLSALVQIYSHKIKQNSFLDLNELKNILNDMKPVGNDLNIYQDSKMRKELAFQRLKEEIMGPDQKSQTKIQQASASKMNSSSGFKRPGVLHNNNKKSSILGKSKLTLNNCIQEERDTKLRIRKGSCYQKVVSAQSQKENLQVKNIDELTKKGILFDVLLPLNNKIYIVQISFTFRNGFSLLDFAMTVISDRFLYEKYLLAGLQNVLQTVTLQNLGKLLEMIGRKIFGQNAQFLQLHNLIVADQQIPEKLEPISFALMRIKAIIKQHLRRTYQEEYMMGKKFIYPKIKVIEINQFLLQRVKDQENRKIRSAFEKRKGFVLKDKTDSSIKSPESDMLFVKLIIGRFLQASKTITRQYYFFNVYYNTFFKGLDVFGLEGSTSDETFDLNDFVNKMKKITKNCQQKHRIIDKGKTVRALLKLQNKPLQPILRQDSYRLEEELQLTSPRKIDHQILNLNIFGTLKHRGPKKQSRPYLETIRTNLDEYSIFRRQKQGDSVRFSNQKCILDIPNLMVSSQLAFQKKRLRMYNSIKICEKGAETQNLKTTIKKGNIVVATKQKIVLKYCRHFVVRKLTRGYFLVVEYEEPEQRDIVYEIVVNPTTRYYCLSKQKIASISATKIKIDSESFCGKQMHLYKGNRQQISEANYFYLNNLKGLQNKQEIYEDSIQG